MYTERNGRQIQERAMIPGISSSKRTRSFNLNTRSFSHSSLSQGEQPFPPARSSRIEDFIYSLSLKSNLPSEMMQRIPRKISWTLEHCGENAFRLAIQSDTLAEPVISILNNRMSGSVQAFTLGASNVAKDAFDSLDHNSEQQVLSHVQVCSSRKSRISRWHICLCFQITNSVPSWSIKVLGQNGIHINRERKALGDSSSISNGDKIELDSSISYIFSVTRNELSLPQPITIDSSDHEVDNVANDEEIRKKTRLQEDDAEKENEKHIDLIDQVVGLVTCAICQEIVIDPLCGDTCGHVFCAECIIPWLFQTESCPSCRSEFSKDLLVTEKQSSAFLNLLLERLTCSKFARDPGYTENVQKRKNLLQRESGLVPQLIEDLEPFLPLIEDVWNEKTRAWVKSNILDRLFHPRSRLRILARTGLVPEKVRCWNPQSLLVCLINLGCLPPGTLLADLKDTSQGLRLKIGKFICRKLRK